MMKFINSKEGIKTISLGARNVKNSLQRIRIELDNAPKHDTIEIIEVKELVYTPRQSFGNKTLLQRLKEIENG